MVWPSSMSPNVWTWLRGFGAVTDTEAAVASQVSWTVCHRAQLGPVDYVISTPDRRKNNRVCHVNLLKEYYERDPRFISCVTSEPSVVMQETVSDKSVMSSSAMDSDLLSSLPAEQQSELVQILAQFANVFSEVPGRTNLTVHHIELLPDTRPIHCTLYRLHSEKREFLWKELDNLLQLGIIEESDSPWASPIVIVPKTDGTLRLCTDFRKVNGLGHPICYYSKKLDTYH